MTDHSNLRELYRLHTESQSKYVYFLLAATGAAVGYGLQKLEGLPLSWENSVGVLAMLLSLLSFFCGCKRITATQNAMFKNYEMLQVKCGIRADQPLPQFVHAVAEATRSAVEAHSNKANSYFNLQFWFLASGIASFVVWRILEMARVSTP